LIRLHKLVTATTQLVIILQLKASTLLLSHKVARPPCCYCCDKTYKTTISREEDW